MSIRGRVTFERANLNGRDYIVAWLDGPAPQPAAHVRCALFSAKSIGPLIGSLIGRRPGEAP